MKKIFNILLAATFAMPLFTACDKDDSSNPVLLEPETFTLNTPSYAANNIYDLKNSTVVELTCTQPDYGFPASTTYAVQASLSADFVEEDGDIAANYAQLDGTYTTAKMDVDASELNSSLLELWAAANGDQAALPTDPIAVYIRLKANVTGSDKGTCISNVIELPKVMISKESGSLSVPTTMYIIGSMLDNWGVWKPMAATYGLDGQFYSLIYFDANSEFKFGTKVDEYIGATDNRVTVDDKASAGITGSDNFVVGTAGWYVVYIKATVKSSEYAFTMTFYPGDVYLFGKTNGGSYAYADNLKFTAPADKDGDFVSPVMTASGEVRMCVKTDVDWWRTEFTVNSSTNEIYYRDLNIVDSWTEKGSEYSIQGAAGQQMHMNFTAGTGNIQ